MTPELGQLRDAQHLRLGIIAARGEKLTEAPHARRLEQHATDTAPNDAAGSDPIRSP